jgi:hypothetical protein
MICKGVRPTGRRPAVRRFVPAVALVSLVGAAACADSSGGNGGSSVEAIGEFEATTDFLRQAAERSTSDGYRTEMRMSVTGEVDDDAPAFMSGVVDGDRQHITIDLSTVMAQSAELAGQPLPPEMGQVDWTMEMAADPEVIYLRAPMYAQLAELADGAALGPAAGLAEIGDGWGYIDVAALGDKVPSDVAAALGSGGADPAAIVDAIAAAESVEDAGTSEVRGTPVHGMSAEVSMGEIMEASGQDPDAMAEAIGMGAGAEAVADAIYELTAPVTVWIDDDGLLRRMEYGFDMAEALDAAGAGSGGLGAAGVAGMQFNAVVDMFDHGAELEFEPPDDAVDVTDTFAALMNL